MKAQRMLRVSSVSVFSAVLAAAAALAPSSAAAQAADTWRYSATNQPDGIHPKARGHERVAENVWKALEPQLDDENRQPMR